MTQKEIESAIPQQYKGNKLNVEHAVIAPSIKEAVNLFGIATKRLLNVNNWQDITSSAFSEFKLTDANGLFVNREARENDLFKIKIPGPGSDSGEGYDWVRVETIKIKPTSVSMLVRPVASPLHPEEGTAHFFKNDATSTFQVFRKGRIVTAAVYGRNEIPNVEATHKG